MIVISCVALTRKNFSDRFLMNWNSHNSHVKIVIKDFDLFLFFCERILINFLFLVAIVVLVVLTCNNVEGLMPPQTFEALLFIARIACSTERLDSEMLFSLQSISVDLSIKSKRF